MAKKSAIYTRTGDLGETSLFGGKRVKKNSQRINTLGTIDELNALLGLAISQVRSKKLIKQLETIQTQLFEIGAEVANSNANLVKSSSSRQLDEAKTTELENFIDEIDSKLPALRNFILPGGSFSSSLIHYCRTLCRRAERELTSLSEKEIINPSINKYLNRLSDFLFVAARYTNKNHGKKETIWKGR